MAISATFDSTINDHVTCFRCGTLAPVGASPCVRCGVALTGAQVYMDVPTRVRLLDALRVADLDECVRVVLAAHADGLIEVSA